MPSNTYTGIFSGNVTGEFIEQRWQKINSMRGEDTEMNLYRRWDSEFPEWDICNHDVGHTLHVGYHYDTNHVEYGRCDFKYAAKNGAHISEWIQKQIRNGKIDTIVLWRWLTPWERPLKLNEFVSYEILEYIPAKVVLSSINEENRYKTNTFD